MRNGHAAISFMILFNSKILCGFIAVFLGKDLDFDLANYHYYNAFALLHHRFNIDYWPPSYIHVFFSPTADLLTYFLINNLPPLAAVFLSGSLHGINLWLLYLIAQCFLPKKIFAILFAVFIAIIGMMGAMTFPSIGNFKNDLIVSLFILSFILLQIKVWQNDFSKTREMYLRSLLATCFLGLGLGIKLTASLFLVGSIGALLCLPLPNKIKINVLMISLLGTILGLAISGGYWMLMLWHRYHNPVFPFLNQIFHAVDYPAINFRYDEFIPADLKHFIFYPFYFSWNGTIADGRFLDFRFLIVYLLMICTGVSLCYRKLRFRVQKSISLPLTWLILFFIFSYLTCEMYFGSIRYMLVLEMLSPLMIFLLFKTIFKNSLAVFLTLCVFVFLTLTSKHALVGTRVKSYGEDYFHVSLPNFIVNAKEALVLTPYTIYARSNDPRPQTYLIAFLPKQWQYIGIPFHQEKFIYPENNVINNIQQIISNPHPSIFLLTVEESMPELLRAAKIFQLKPTGRCEKIFSERQLVNLSNVLLCEMKKNPCHAESVF